jgi:hypothetical protein
MTPKQWAALVRLNVRLGTDTVEPIPGYGDLETLGYGKNNVVMRQAAVNHAARTDATNRVFHTTNTRSRPRWVVNQCGRRDPGGNVTLAWAMSLPRDRLLIPGFEGFCENAISRCAFFQGENRSPFGVVDDWNIYPPAFPEHRLITVLVRLGGGENEQEKTVRYFLG